MSNIEKLLETIATLRSENGCKWDREQTHKSLRTNMLEEAYEAVDALNSGDCKHLKEELGDVLMQVVLHSQIATDNGTFNFDDVAKTVNEKLIYRHPHVFSDTKVKDVEEILSNWDKLKAAEKPHRKSILDGVSKSQAALMSAQKISNKVVKVGFEWQNIDQIYDCVQSEIQEFKEAKTQEEKELEFGDILFTLVNVARWEGLDAEQCLIKANEKFQKRFRKMEEITPKTLTNLTFDEWEELWVKAKKSL